MHECEVDHLHLPLLPLLLLLVSVDLPVLTSLLRRAEPLWRWYGTVALRGCRLGLLHPRGAPPLLLDIPHSAPTAELHLWKHTHARTHTQTTSQVFFLCLFCSPSTFSFSREKEIHGGHSAPWTPSFLSEQMMTMTIICVLHSFFFLLLLTAYPQVFNRGEKGGESRGAQCAAVNESQALVLDSSSFMLRFKKDGEGCA